MAWRYIKGDTTATEFCGMWQQKGVKTNASILERIRSLFVSEHKWHYDAESLAELLKEAGFRVVGKHKFQQSRMATIAVIEKVQYPSAIYIEAVKLP